MHATRGVVRVMGHLLSGQMSGNTMVTEGRGMGAQVGERIALTEAVLNTLFSET